MTLQHCCYDYSRDLPLFYDVKFAVAATKAAKCSELKRHFEIPSIITRVAGQN